jgi:hypothetical protein
MTKKKVEEIITVEYLITREFNTATDFSQHIERESIRRGISHMETLLDYCETRNIDPSSVTKLISSSLKEKIKAEAEDLNLLKKKSGKLPL